MLILNCKPHSTTEGGKVATNQSLEPAMGPSGSAPLRIVSALNITQGKYKHQREIWNPSFGAPFTFALPYDEIPDTKGSPRGKWVAIRCLQGGPPSVDYLGGDVAICGALKSNILCVKPRHSPGTQAMSSRRSVRSIGSGRTWNQRPPKPQWAQARCSESLRRGF